MDSFDLAKVPRGPLLSPPYFSAVVPLIFHGSKRIELIALESVSLPFSAMIDRRSGRFRFQSASELREKYKLCSSAKIILSGVGEDRPIERWWGIGTKNRLEAIRALQSAEIDLVTTPNFSLTLNAPRWDDLHAMKRIAIVFSEFLNEGMPAALHVNARTDDDFTRWTDFIGARKEVTHVAYEFTTGTRWTRRREQHVAWLSKLATSVGRPLHLIVRGGFGSLGRLAHVFDKVTVLETGSFMFAVKRQQAFLRGANSVRRSFSPTADGEPLDALLTNNIKVLKSAIEAQLHSGI